MKRIFFFIWNFWPPFWGAGIKIDWIAKDFMSVRVRLKRRPWTKNIVGTQFGGSIYAMTDPFYMVLLLQNLGRDYIVWDKAASIRFRRPGRSDLIAEFAVSRNDIDDIKSRLETEPKIDWTRDVLVKDADGKTVAEIHKIVHIKKKR